MKKIFLILAILGTTTQVFAKTNLQLHYDFGDDRKFLTSTFEMFEPDDWGNTYFFVDFDYNTGPEKNTSTAYLELARCFSIKQSAWSLQLEFNAGLSALGLLSIPISNCYLAGLDRAWFWEKNNTALNIKALYKYIAGKQHSAQLTAVWEMHFLDQKLSFAGFADYWLEHNNFSGKDRYTTFISEPQLWWNFNEHFSLGGEMELALNFGGREGFVVRPTLGIKWIF